MNDCDLFSSTTHLTFAGFLFIAGVFLFRSTRGHELFRRRAVQAFVLSAILLYVASGVFHGVRYFQLGAPELFRRFDLCGIFLLVGGSLLPLFGYLLFGRTRVVMTAIVGVLTASGIMTVWLLDTPTSGTMVPMYAVMALIGLIPLPTYVRVGGWRVVRWMLSVAAVYAAGGVCEVLQRPTLIPGLIGPHEVLHLTDIGGTSLHLWLVFQLVESNEWVPAVVRRRDSKNRPNSGE